MSEPSKEALVAAKKYDDYLDAFPGIGRDNRMAHLAEIIERHFTALRQENEDLREALAHCEKQMEMVCESQLHPDARNPFTNALIGARTLLASKEGK